MNNDTSFIELTYPENLVKICIDQRIIPTFVNTMYRMQNYFNKHNYTKNFDYRSLFKEFILSDDIEKKLKIYSDPKLNEIGWNGYHNGKENKIVLNETMLNTRYLEFTLCHEFIHFITEKVLKKRLLNNPKNIKCFRNDFIKEALTEMLSMQIYPEYSRKSGYSANVKMMEFFNKLSGSINHYQSFLLGHIDIKIANWWKKTQVIKSYEEDFFKFVTSFYLEQENYFISNAISSYNYQGAQRSIILGFLEKVNNFDDYFSFLENVANPPIKDDVFLNNTLLKKEMSLIDNLNIENISYKNILLNSLINFRNSILNYYKNNIELPFPNGFIYLYDNLDYATYGNAVVGRIERFFYEGSCKYIYVVNGMEYVKTVDKINEYQNLIYSRDMFAGHLNYILANNSKEVQSSRKS